MAGLPTTQPIGKQPFANPVATEELYANILYDLGQPLPAVRETTIRGLLRALDLQLYLNNATTSEVKYGPASTIAATLDRRTLNLATGAVTTGDIYLAAIWLPQNLVVTNMIFHPGTTGDAGPSHQWMVLTDSARIPLAYSADATSTAITASTPVTYPIHTVKAGTATTFTTAYAGWYYLGFMLATSNAPVFQGQTGIAGANGIAPILGGLSSTGQTTVPTNFSSALTSITAEAAIPYLTLS